MASADPLNFLEKDNSISQNQEGKVPKYHVLKKVEGGPVEDPLFICGVGGITFFQKLYFAFMTLVGKASFLIIVPESFLVTKCTPEQKGKLDAAF